MATWTLLYYDAVGLDYTNEGINPHFICPECHVPWQPKYKPIPTLPTTYDLNTKITFTCPNCAAKIVLFVAIHKDPLVTRLCLQKSSDEGANGIPINWWSI